MRKKFGGILAVISVLVLLGACAMSQPVMNVDQAPIASNKPKPSMDEIRQAIVRAGSGLGWQMDADKTGHVTGRLLLRTHVAVVDVDYTQAVYSIKYRESTNLDYAEGKFHKNYNGWIQNLDKAIMVQLQIRCCYASSDVRPAHMGNVSDYPAGALTREATSSPPALLAVVIPAYNEASTIRDVAMRALREVERVIVVDDGSEDGTAAALHGLPVTVLCNPRNLGKAASLRRGMLRALEERVSAVVSRDAAGPHPPQPNPRLHAAPQRDPQSIVVGARLHEKARMPRARYLANRFANFWIAWAAGYPISDSQSGFRLYPASVLRAIDIRHDTSPGFVFESAVLINAARVGVTSIAVGIPAIYKPGARPSHFRPVTDILLITRMVAWKLITRGLDLPGLVRSRRSPDRTRQTHVV
jgi:hypothetical protein